LAIGIVVAAGTVMTFAGRSRVGTPSATVSLPGLDSRDCVTSACTRLEHGDSISLFNGVVTCKYMGTNPQWYKARSCFFGNMFDRKCDFIPCAAPGSSPVCAAECRSHRDCSGGGFCVNAHYVDSQLIVDQGECNKVATRSLDSPSICFTCKCMAR
jgi:hypothetical protein